MKKSSKILFAALIYLLAACSAGAPQMAAPEEVFGEGGAGFEEEAAFEPAPETARDAAPSSVDEAAVERLVIKNGNLSIAVDDPEGKLSQVMALADEMGGFVVTSSLYFRTLESGVEVPQADVTIRVPADRFDEALEQIKTGVGQVLSEAVQGQDVTQEYTDLKSRLSNLLAAEVELQRIMEEASDTEDVLNVYNQLISIREQIEVIQGRINYFEQSAAFSAIAVSIIADEAVQPLTIGGWQPVGVAKNAIQALINTLKGIANALIWITLYVLPVLVVLYIPLRLIWAGIRRLRARNTTDTKPTDENN